MSLMLAQHSFYLLAIVTYYAHGDVYLHNPRGSNNRLDEDRRERNNANRLFDSQNNNRGGYNVGSLYYYAGSKLQIEWTNQHSCGATNNNCEIVIQYMCSNSLRDGATTTAVPENPMECRDYNCNTDLQYGLHEDYDYYLNCRLRDRQRGLFTADQNVRGGHRDKAINTRQNPAGTRRGYECPEERDYYPYWHPTPWKDIVVLTNDADRCAYYQNETQNVQSRWMCVVPRTGMLIALNQGQTILNNEQQCQEFTVLGLDGVTPIPGVWQEFPAHGLPPPDCRETDFTRDNHLGNGLGGNPAMYNWTIPVTLEHEQCAIRIRYNISTSDYDAWGTNSSYNKAERARDRGFYGDAAMVPMGDRFSFPNDQAAAERGWVIKNNPQVQLFAGLDALKWQLAVNTAQYGRTFQDRSHSFAVRPRPSDIDSSATIHNLNVRGKRGNIVQVYPAVEYDFVPNTLELQKNSYVHIQWTGSNTNPNNNDGQGRAGTDRSNMVLQAPAAYDEGEKGSDEHGRWGRSYPTMLPNSTLMQLSTEDLSNLAFLSPGQFRGELSELDDAGTYFDLGPRKVTTPAIYHYMSTRNNNFSNRSQKGRIIVSRAEITHHSVGVNGAQLSLDQGRVTIHVESGVFPKLHKLRVEIWGEDDGRDLVKNSEHESPVGDDYVSSFLSITPDTSLTHEDRKFKITIPIRSAGSTFVYHTSADFSTWSKIHGAEISNGEARFEASRGGTYVVVKQQNLTAIIAGVTVSLVVVLVVVIVTVLYFRRYPEKLNACTRSFRRTV